MLDEAIVSFLDDKKQRFLKNKIKANTCEEDKIKLNEESQEKYKLENWLLDASNRAKQLSMTSHPPKFIHPDAKTSSIIASNKKENDGLLRSGNVTTEIDVFGNAAALDVEKFLRIELQDNKTILDHLDENTDFIKEQFRTNKLEFEEIRKRFMKIKHSDLNQTSDKLKQVYFPVNGDYHLLSILNASGIVFKLKKRINDLRFSDENKMLREEKKKIKPTQIKGKITEIYSLTSIGYGGTQSQNISILNARHGGVSFLLSSIPPVLEKRRTQPPKTDFFENCLWPKLFETNFEQFHLALISQENNKKVREHRDDIVLDSIWKIQRLIENIRSLGVGWSETETYSGLVQWQKIWLDEKYSNIRQDPEQNHNYLLKVQTYFANWFIGNYKKVIKENKQLGDDDIDQIKKILKLEQELLK